MDEVIPDVEDVVENVVEGVENIVEDVIEVPVTIIKEVAKVPLDILGVAEKTAVAESKDVNLVEMVIGASVGYFVWLFWGKVTKDNPLKPKAKVKTVTYGGNMIVSDALKTEPEDKNITPQLKNDLVSFW